MDSFEYILLLFNTGLLAWVLKLIYDVNAQVAGMRRELDEHEKLINYLMSKLNNDNNDKKAVKI